MNRALYAHLIHVRISSETVPGCMFRHPRRLHPRSSLPEPRSKTKTRTAGRAEYLNLVPFSTISSHTRSTRKNTKSQAALTVVP